MGDGLIGLNTYDSTMHILLAIVLSRFKLKVNNDHCASWCSPFSIPYTPGLKLHPRCPSSNQGKLPLFMGTLSLLLDTDIF